MLKNKKILFIFLLILIVGVFFVIKYQVQKKDSTHTLRLAIMGEPEILDPNYTTRKSESIVLTDLFSGLLGKDAKGESIPDMAEFWEVNEDGTVYTFNLRKSQWSDGTQVTAHDFVYSYKRKLNPQNITPYVDLLYVIKGAENYNKGQVGEEELKVIAKDDKTLVIELEYPASYFLSMLHHYAFFPIPQHIVEKYGKDWSNPANIVSNGAYKIEEWKPKSHIKAIKNEFYYANENTKTENIIYYTQEDKDIILKKFRSKEIDISYDFGSDQYEWIVNNLQGQYRVFPYVGIYYLSINTKNKELSDIRIREAINLIIDREFITEKVLKSGEKSAYSMIPEGIKNYKPFELTFKNMSKKERLEKSKELLKQAGFNEKNKLNIEISSNIDENNNKVMIAIANMLNEAGIKSHLIYTDIKNHYNNMEKGNYQIGKLGLISDYDDPLSFLSMGEKGVTNNYAKFSDKNYDALLNKAKVISKEAKRNEYYKQAEKILLESSSYIPIYYYVSKSLVSDEIQGFIPNIINIHPSKYICFKS